MHQRAVARSLVVLALLAPVLFTQVTSVWPV